MGKQCEVFEILASAASEIDNLSWKEIEKAMNKKGVSLTATEKIYIGQKVSAKLKDYSVTTLPLLNAIKQYKDYSFKSDEKTECMPEIPGLEEVLKTVDKTQPIASRVYTVLEAMDIHKLTTEEQDVIVRIANAAMRVTVISISIIMKMARIPEENFSYSRMLFAKFINDFVSAKESNNKVNMVEFLEYFRKSILNESEILH